MPPASPSIAILTPQEPRAVPFAVTRFEVLSADGDWGNHPEAHNGWKSSSRGEVEAATLDEAVALAISRFSFQHKQIVMIRETGTRFVQWANDTEERPYDVLHVFQVKKRSAPTYVYRDYQHHREDRLYAAPVCTIDMRMLTGGAR